MRNSNCPMMLGELKAHLDLSTLPDDTKIMVWREGKQNIVDITSAKFRPEAIDGPVLYLLGEDRYEDQKDK